MKIWTIEEEASALRARFEGVNRAAFARDHEVKGGQAMIYQHITGRRPLNLEAATVYAKGFGCSLAEISPRLAGEAQKAAALTSDATPAASPTVAPWPFSSIDRERIEALPAERLKHLEGVMLFALQGYSDGATTITVPERPASSFAAPTRGSVVDIDVAADEFPMRIKGLPPAPWEGGNTTHQAEANPKIRISTQTGVVANVGPGEPYAANDKFEKVPEMADVRLAAGDGIENHLEEQTGVMHFRRSFLRAVGADAGKARVVYAKGDSMEPIIRDGAALLVVPNEDLTVRDLAAGGVYAINYDGKMIVKTVTRDRLTKQWVARSFNPAYPDIPLENGTPVRVLGQVVWSGARLRDDEAGQWVKS
ncbi:S24 family peptidase [Achromobacter sp. PD1]|uniref:S24 family peptidase n=1 Tax=Achromobacter sp. PD1 TaxID=3399125 RepID=UPI003AF50237